MRQIKFRAKDTFKSEFFPQRWLYGTPVQDGDDMWMCVKVEDKGIVSVKVDPSTLGQFTGLTDCNGKEIYEGDIISSPLNYVVIVKFGYKEHRVRHHGVEDSFAAYGWIAENIQNGITDFLDNEILQGKVIGNIYDNPELLK
ncbi:MAG: hypothetical protein HDS59_00200 [Barnesiella sp.]|nr:hypothetical protein [Barnesiella sp.]